ncbi:hypothetical protein KKF91_19895 [Myxococcota bacterium]|nr:hypothetical protein [Myxococcota bacterium]
MEDLGQFIVIAIFLAIQGAVALAKRSKAAQDAALELSPPRPAPRPTRRARPQRAPIEEVSQLNARLDALNARLKGHRGTRAHLKRVIDERLRRAYGKLLDDLKARRAVTQVSVDLAQAQVNALEAFERWHAQPQIGQNMASVERFVEDLLEPLRHFAAQRGLSAPLRQPICGPEGARSREVMRALFPEHPVVHVPDAINEDLRAWTLIAHETSALILAQQPEILSNLRRLMPSGGGRAWLPQVRKQQIFFDIDALIALWLPALVTDALAMMLLGPAALHGALLYYGGAGMARLEPGPDGQTASSQPPGAVRLLAARQLLGKMGFEAALRHAPLPWTPPAQIEAPSLSGPGVALDLELLLNPIEALWGHLLSEDTPLLKGYPLGAIHGFKMTIGGWHQVEGLAAAFERGEAPAGAPRLVVAAAVMSALRQPATQSSLYKQLLRALNTSDHGRAATANVGAMEIDDPRRELRDALILRYALWRRR